MVVFQKNTNMHSSSIPNLPLLYKMKNPYIFRVVIIMNNNNKYLVALLAFISSRTYDFSRCLRNKNMRKTSPVQSKPESSKLFSTAISCVASTLPHLSYYTRKLATPNKTFFNYLD